MYKTIGIFNMYNIRTYISSLHNMLKSNARDFETT